jgi:TRAP-type C4-dicarboxylate transport system permease large subunit
MNWKETWKSKWENQPLLMLLTIVIWGIFIGLCIKAGALLFTTVYSLFDPSVAKDLYEGLDMSVVREWHTGYYLAAMSLLLGVLAAKAYIFYLVIRIFLKIDLIHPFSKEVSDLISKIGEVTLQVGILIIIASRYFKWLSVRTIHSPDLGFFLGGAFEFLIMGAVIYAIAVVFRRGVEIQADNDLTV